MERTAPHLNPVAILRLAIGPNALGAQYVTARKWMARYGHKTAETGRVAHKTSHQTYTLVEFVHVVMMEANRNCYVVRARSTKAFCLPLLLDIGQFAFEDNLPLLPEIVIVEI